MQFLTLQHPYNNMGQTSSTLGAWPYARRALKVASEPLLRSKDDQGRKNGSASREKPRLLRVFLWRARQDSNLRPSLFVVILLQGHGQTRRDRERQNSAFIRNLVLLRDTERQGETPGCGQNRGECSRQPGFHTIRDSGGCEKHASEPGDEAFEVGASHFSMLRPYLRALLYD